MKSKLFSQLEQVVREQTLADTGNSDFVNISVRPSPKIAAMLDLVSMMIDKPISTMLTDTISAKLAEHVRSTSKYQNQIVNAVKEIQKERDAISEGSAIDILIKNGNLKISKKNNIGCNHKL